MNETETLETPDNQTILEAILKRFDSFEKNTNDQFEAILKRFGDVDMQLEVVREGIASNSAAFDRLEAKFHDNRSDTLRLRADVKDLTEEIRRIRKESFV